MNLSDRDSLLKFLKKFDLVPKKRLGQHFLCSARVLEEIHHQLEEVQSVLEIGPGPGILTASLCNWVPMVEAIEIDESVIPALKFIAKNARVILGDALKIDWRNNLDKLPRPRVLVSNMPYYITGGLLQKVIEARQSMDFALLMMQEEVGNRISAQAKTGERGSLSVHLQALFTISMVCKVSADEFVPEPKVNSIVLKLIPSQKQFPDRFFEFMRRGFDQPRKTLINNLGKAYELPKESMKTNLQSVGLTDLARAQELTEEEWLALYAKMTPLI